MAILPSVGLLVFVFANCGAPPSGGSASTGVAPAGVSLPPDSGSTQSRSDASATNGGSTPNSVLPDGALPKSSLPDGSPADSPPAGSMPNGLMPNGSTPSDGSSPAVGSLEAGALGQVEAGSSLAPLSRIYGVTVDDISGVTDIVAALSALPHKPTTRIVFDQGQPPSNYTSAVTAISAVSYVMGELLDSMYVSAASVQAYSQRTSDYLAAFPTGVDLWEVGNEINGNWLGNTADVVAKMTAAFDLVKAAHGRTALTLYGCSDSGASYDMLTWAAANVPSRMLSGLDYVLVSYYEGDCGSPRAISDWPSIFQQLHQMFPNSGLGFGEVGSTDSSGNDVSDPTVAGPYLQKYYGMQISCPNYVGGYFWWYFREDMVPMTKPLFSVLSSAMR